MTDDYDVVIVGARCAGATLAWYLARQGARVLVLDRDRLGTDQVLSTHTIHPAGCGVLREVGIFDALRERTPSARLFRMRKNAAVVDIELGEEHAEHCPRRRHLDALLQTAASQAGAELVERARVVSLVVDGERVVGVRATIAGSSAERTIRASLVVGADGRRSTVARLVSAEEELGYDAPRAMYWGYWDEPAGFVEEHRFGMYVGHDHGDVRVVFRTDDRQVLVGSRPPVSRAVAWRSDPARALVEDLSRDPLTRSLVAGRPSASPIRGTLRERYFLRRAAGPGWLLVGDAGVHKEFVIGDGISEALLQARSAAGAIAIGTDVARERWWRARDVEVLPWFFFGQDEGRDRGPSAIDELVMSRVARSPEVIARLAEVLDHRRSPYDVVPPAKVLGWVAGALLRGRFDVVPGFVEKARRGAALERALAERRARLARVDADARVPAESAALRAA